MKHLKRLFGLVLLKKILGFTNKEISNLLPPSSEFGVNKHLKKTYLKSGYNELVRKKIDYLVKFYPESFDPKIVAEIGPHIEEFIQKAIHRDNIMPQLHDIIIHLHNIGLGQIPRQTIGKIMQSIGYSYKKMPVTVADKNKSSVVRQKEIYLKKLFANREKMKEGRGQAEVYIDESFIIDRHIRRFGWMKGGRVGHKIGKNTPEYSNIINQAE